MPLSKARREAQRIWNALKPAGPTGKLTLGEAWRQYIDEKPLAASTQRLYRENLQRYLSDWAGRTLESIGEDRAGVRHLYNDLRRNRGVGIASQVIRQFRAVYNYSRKVDLDLPPNPVEAVQIQHPKPRDWALSDEQLRRWWIGVQRLRPMKQTFWLTLLLTGARRDSVRMLRWADVDFDRALIKFSTAKAGRSYSVPMCKRLVELLLRWREQAVPDCEWVFESPVRPGEPLSYQVRDDKRGLVSAHHLRHTYRTVLAQLGCPPDSARLLLGHSLSGDVSRGYITAGLVTESLRPWAEAVAEHYARVLEW
jgi:integrase